MPYVFQCEACHFKMSISDEMFTRRFDGKQVTVKCKACKGDIHIDGAALAAKPRVSVPRPDPIAVPRPAVSAPLTERVPTGDRPLPPRGELRKTLLGLSPEELVLRRPAPPRRASSTLSAVDPLGATLLDVVPAEINAAPGARAVLPHPSAIHKDAAPASAAAEGSLASAPRNEPDAAREPETRPAQARPAPPRRTRSSCTLNEPRTTVVGVAPPHLQDTSETRVRLPHADTVVRMASPRPAAPEGPLESEPGKQPDAAREAEPSPVQARPAPPPRRTRLSSALNALRTTALGVGPARLPDTPEAPVGLGRPDAAAEDPAPAPAAPESSLESAPGKEPVEICEPEPSPDRALETASVEMSRDADPGLPPADGAAPELADGAAPEPAEPAHPPDAGPAEAEAEAESEASFVDREPVTPPISWAPGPPSAARKRPRRRYGWVAVLVSVVGIGGGALAAVRWIPLQRSATAAVDARAAAPARQRQPSAPPRQEQKPAPTQAERTASPAPDPAPSRAQSAPAAPAPQSPSAAPSASAGESSSIPEGVRQNVLQYRVYLAMKKAEDCHRGGRARGKAQVFLTFAPNGHVSRAWLEGEPIASAPVGRCVLELASAVRLPPYQGEPFTYKTRITLR